VCVCVCVCVLVRCVRDREEVGQQTKRVCAIGREDVTEEAGREREKRACVCVMRYHITLEALPANVRGIIRISLGHTLSHTNRQICVAVHHDSLSSLDS
jgi:hypothetical protein